MQEKTPHKKFGPKLRIFYGVSFLFYISLDTYSVLPDFHRVFGSMACFSFGERVGKPRKYNFFIMLGCTQDHYQVVLIRRS